MFTFYVHSACRLIKYNVNHTNVDELWKFNATAIRLDFTH